MKKLFLPLLFLSLMSCMTEEEKLIKNAESYINDSLVQNMNDPESYQPISTKIIDTMKLHLLHTLDTTALSAQKRILNYLTYLDSSRVLLYMNYGLSYQSYYESFKQNKDSLKICSHKLDSIKNVMILKNDTNKIAYINLKHIYRFKNKFGGKEIDTLNMVFVNINVKTHFVNYKKGFYYYSKILGAKK